MQVSTLGARELQHMAATRRRAPALQLLAAGRVPEREVARVHRGSKIWTRGLVTEARMLR